MLEILAFVAKLILERLAKIVSFNTKFLLLKDFSLF